MLHLQCNGSIWRVGAVVGEKHLTLFFISINFPSSEKQTRDLFGPLLLSAIGGDRISHAAINSCCISIRAGYLGTWKSGHLEIWGLANPETWDPENEENTKGLPIFLGGPLGLCPVWALAAIHPWYQCVLQPKQMPVFCRHPKKCAQGCLPRLSFFQNSGPHVMIGTLIEA